LSFVKNNDVKIAGISCVVPDNPIKVDDLGAPYFQQDVIDRIRKRVGTDTL